MASLCGRRRRLEEEEEDRRRFDPSTGLQTLHFCTSASLLSRNHDHALDAGQALERARESCDTLPLCPARGQVGGSPSSPLSPRSRALAARRSPRTLDHMAHSIDDDKASPTSPFPGPHAPPPPSSVAPSHGLPAARWAMGSGCRGSGRAFDALRGCTACRTPGRGRQLRVGQAAGMTATRAARLTLAASPS